MHGLKKLSVFFLIFSVGLFAFSQDSLETTPEKINSPVINERDLVIGEGTANTGQTQPLQTNSLWLFIRLILVLILVIAAIYGIIFVLKKGFNPRESVNPFLKQLAVISLGPGKSIQIIVVGNQAFLVGVSESNVQTLGEITDKELIDSIILHASKQPSGKPKDFSSILSSIIPALKKESSKQDSFSFDVALQKTAQDTEDLLRKHRERLGSLDGKDGDQ